MKTFSMKNVFTDTGVLMSYRFTWYVFGWLLVLLLAGDMSIRSGYSTKELQIDLPNAIEAFVYLAVVAVPYEIVMAIHADGIQVALHRKE